MTPRGNPFLSCIRRDARREWERVHGLKWNGRRTFTDLRALNVATLLPYGWVKCP